MAHNIILGLGGLNHPELEKHFFPDDLPPDWRLDYYSNEYRAILVSPEELGRLSKPFDCHDLLNAVTDCTQELLNNEFTLMVDISAQFEALSTSILSLTDSAAEFGDKAINFIYSLQLCNKQHGLYRAKVLFAPEKYHVLVCQTEMKLEPMELKQLLLYCREYPAEKLYVFFTAATNGLENCSNAMTMNCLL